MYKSSYSQANFGLAAKKMHKSKGKSCGYYMKIVFFFSSLIQSLIIASLVLFLVYGQPEHTVEEKRLQELDQSVSKLTMENFVLRGKEKNLTKILNATLTAKLKDDKSLSELRKLANTSTLAIKTMQTTMSHCEMEKRMATPRSCPPTFCPDPNEQNKRLQSMLQQSNEMLTLVKANFTQKMDIMRTELDGSNKAKDEYHLEAIRLRRDKAFLEEELVLYQKKCKEDFVASLRGIPNVTKEFLKRIDDLFSKHISFQLTCDKQKNQLENIRENCSSLSREVENKLQSYLDIVGNQFTNINGENAKYVIENIRLKEDAEWCNQNRSAMNRESHKNLEQLQLKCDQDSEKLLLENRKLKGENDLKENLLSVKEKEVKMLSSTIETLNTSLASCKPAVRTNSFMPNSFGLPNVPSAGGTSLLSFNGAGSSSRRSSTGLGVAGPLNTAPGGTGTLPSALGSTGLAGPGSSRTGLVQTGTSSLSGVGSTGTGFGVALGGTKSTVSGSDNPAISQAQINLHLKELLRYSIPN